MAVRRDIGYARAMRRKGEVKTQLKILSEVKLGKTGQQIPPHDAMAIRTAVERILLEDRKSLIFAIGGVARMYKGQQPFFRDIDLAVVTGKGGAYNKLSTLKFKKEIQNLSGKEVDVFAFKRQHFKPLNLIRELKTERRQELYPLQSIAEGLPLYNVHRGRNLQKQIENVLKVEFEKKEQDEINRVATERSWRRRLLGRK
jgi:predicted nucleotidyltransferase